MLFFARIHGRLRLRLRLRQRPRSRAVGCDNAPMEMLVVTLASLFAGFVDSMVGGGGLILVPALLTTFPNAHPATLFGTNKGASVWGTGMATWQYSRRVSLPWHALLPASLAAMLASLAGAWLVTVASPDYLRKILPVILLLVLGYTLAKKELGRHHVPTYSGRMEAALACCMPFAMRTAIMNRVRRSADISLASGVTAASSIQWRAI